MHTPYQDPARDAIYNGLFCDGTGAPTGPADIQALRSIALDAGSESRAVASAWRRLREAGQPVPPRELLGVVIEVPLESGLDTLAAYRDGSVRFMHGSGAATFIEGPNAAVAPLVERIMAAAQAIVDRIGPTVEPRRPAPARNVRMSFIVSDGLYFGEGPMQALMGDGLAGPLLQAGVGLLDALTGLTATA
jgi:hypothetical protein